MKWKYSLSTNTIWTSFDYGEVEADTQDEALRLAEIKLTDKLNKINRILGDKSAAHEREQIGMDMSQIEVEPIIQKPKIRCSILNRMVFQTIMFYPSLETIRKYGLLL